MAALLGWIDWLLAMFLLALPAGTPTPQIIVDRFDLLAPIITKVAIRNEWISTTELRYHDLWLKSQRLYIQTALGNGTSAFAKTIYCTKHGTGYATPRLIIMAF